MHERPAPPTPGDARRARRHRRPPGHRLVRRAHRRRGGPADFSLIAGGRSNPTFRVVDAAGHAFALRRPPLHHVLPTAHDMAREYRVMTGLGSTAVPVPVTYGLCQDEAVNGAPFYVMEFVDGHILRTHGPGRGGLRRGRPGRGAVRTWPPPWPSCTPSTSRPPAWATSGGTRATWPASSGAGPSSTADGRCPGSTTAAWSSRSARTLARPHPDPAWGRPSSTATTGSTTRCSATDGSVRAVLDWEICTLGDPMADVGLLMVYWTDPEDEAGPARRGGHHGARASPGGPRCWRRYAAASGRDVSGVDYFTAFGYWKLACILQGVYARYVAGAGAGRPQQRRGVPGPGRAGWPEMAADRLAGDEPGDRPLYEGLDRPVLDRPVLVVALEGWVDAGLGSSTAVATLLAESPLETLATFDSDHFLDQRARRPVARIVNGVTST